MEYARTTHKEKFGGSEVWPLKKDDERRQWRVDERRERPIEPYESKASATSTFCEEVPRSVDEGCCEYKD